MNQDAIIANPVVRWFGKQKPARWRQKLFSTPPQSVIGTTQTWLALLVGFQSG